MCIKPLWLRKLQQEVPCGRCFECIKRRRNDWYLRCLIESRHKKHTYFGLLTYADVGTSLDKRDIQLFLKRLRSYGYQFSYFIAGEHGELKDRPHWHCLFFSDNPIGYKHIAQAWRGGYAKSTENIAGWIRFEPIKSARSIRYTVKYIYKYAGNDPRFSLMVSKNPSIGHSFLRNIAYFLENETTRFTFDGKETAMPRYFKRKFFDDYPEIKERVNSALADKVAQLSDAELAMATRYYEGLTIGQTKRKIYESKCIFNEQWTTNDGIQSTGRKP